MLWRIKIENRRGVIVMIDLYEEKQIINAMTTKLKEMGNSL